MMEMSLVSSTGTKNRGFLLIRRRSQKLLSVWVSHVANTVILGCERIVFNRLFIFAEGFIEAPTVAIKQYSTQKRPVMLQSKL